MASMRRDTRASDYDDTGQRSTSEWRCPLCLQADPQQRAAHHLDLARHSGLDGLREHLTAQCVDLRPADRQRPELVDDICQWVAQLMEQYAHMVDLNTGAPLAWWEARRQMHGRLEAIAEAAYEHAPRPYRFRRDEAIRHRQARMRQEIQDAMAAKMAEYQKLADELECYETSPVASMSPGTPFPEETPIPIAFVEELPDDLWAAMVSDTTA